MDCSKYYVCLLMYCGQLEGHVCHCDVQSSGSLDFVWYICLVSYIVTGIDGGEGPM
jgi:hypothetical protein